MIYIETNSTDPFFNFGLEYYLLTQKRADDDVFLLWRTVPTLMLGAFQNVHAEANLAYLREKGIRLARRISGGGAIYTDPGAWQFSFISPRGAGEDLSFQRFAAPVLRVLNELGVPAVFGGRNDLTVHGRKCAGVARCVKNGRVLCHGSLLFDTDLGEMAKSAAPDASKIVTKGVRSLRARVVNLSEFLPDMDALSFKKRLLSGILRESGEIYALTDGEIALAQAFAKEKFDNWDAVYGVSPAADVTRKRRFPGGSVECALRIEKGTLKGVRLFGDFFGEYDSAAFEAHFLDCPYDAAHVRARLEKAEISLLGVGKDDLLALLVP
jgi:lipoate-protein ligase A